MSTEQQQDAKDDNLAESWEEVHFQQTTPSLGMSAMYKTLQPGTIERKIREAQYDRQQLLPPSEPTLTRQLSDKTIMELIEAQKESSRNTTPMGSNVGSNTSSRASPNRPRSPCNELGTISIEHVSSSSSLQGARTPDSTDWIWDWSSRIEVVPPGEMGGAKYRPFVKKVPLSVRNTHVMRSGPFCLENLPIMLLTHACTFFLGAAVVFVYLKKYCGWSSVTID